MSDAAPLGRHSSFLQFSEFSPASHCEFVSKNVFFGKRSDSLCQFKNSSYFCIAFRRITGNVLHPLDDREQ